MFRSVLMAFALLAPFAAPAQYPSQTVRVVVGFPPGGTPEALAAFLEAEQDKWGRVIRELNINLQ